MSEYAQRFADNDIDASVLPELTDPDLKDLGVSLGSLPQNCRPTRCPWMRISAPMVDHSAIDGAGVERAEGDAKTRRGLKIAQPLRPGQVHVMCDPVRLRRSRNFSQVVRLRPRI